MAYSIFLARTFNLVALPEATTTLQSLIKNNRIVSYKETMESPYNMDGTGFVGMTEEAHALDGGRNNNACTPVRRQSFFKPVGISRQCDLGVGIFHRASQISQPFVPTATIKEFTPPPSPFDSSKMILLKTPSSVRTVETVATTPESIASCTSYLSAASSSFCMTTPTKRTNFPTTVIQSNFLKDSLASVVNTTTKQSLVKRKKKAKSQSRFDTQRQPIDDFARKQKQKQKVKTELCMYYLSNRNCPFGSNCSYAHGEKELQMTRLMDLQRNGLIDDAETYRIKPCFDFVAMGSCPFGVRCSEIHDTRVAGKTHSWLPITETQGNNISTDVNVESMHQKRRREVLTGNPLGIQLSFDGDGWSDLYNLVSNIAAKGKRAEHGTISEVHKLDIALQMRGGHKWMYKYRPSHVIFQEMCMILDERAFHCDDKTGKSVPIYLSEYNPRNPEHVIVREIAFGPDQDPSVDFHPVLFFSIPAGEIAECTTHQQKRFRWKRQERKTSYFDFYESFVMIRPNDSDTFDLVTNILLHRLDTVKAGRLPSINDRFAALEKVSKNRLLLCTRFSSIMKHWLAFAYPANSSHQPINNDTPVPPVDTEYSPIKSKASNSLKNESEGIWESFVDTLVSLEDSNCYHDSHYHGAYNHCHRRLSIFEKLSHGEIINEDRSLPHIMHRTDVKKKTNEKPKYSLQSESCWKSLLLKNDGPQMDEWAVVMEHFTSNYSRCKKVLNILQQ